MNPSKTVVRRIACLAILIVSGAIGTGCAAPLQGRDASMVSAGRSFSAEDSGEFDGAFGSYEDARVRTAGTASGRPGITFAGVLPQARSLEALRVAR
jgi:hypothetical protein